MQKNASDYFPDWIRRARLAKEDGEVDHVVAEDAATLVYLANQACITLHVGLVAHRPDRSSRHDGARSRPLGRRFRQGEARRQGRASAARGGRPHLVPPDHGLARAARLGAARSQRDLRRGARDRLRPCRGARRPRARRAHHRAAQGEARRSRLSRRRPQRLRPDRRSRPIRCARGPRPRSPRRSTGTSSTSPTSARAATRSATCSAGSPGSPTPGRVSASTRTTFGKCAAGSPHRLVEGQATVLS